MHQTPQLEEESKGPMRKLSLFASDSAHDPKSCPGVPLLELGHPQKRYTATNTTPAYGSLNSLSTKASRL